MEVLEWHPRDVETWIEMDLADAEEQKEQARDERFAAATQQLKQQMGR